MRASPSRVNSVSAAASTFCRQPSLRGRPTLLAGSVSTGSAIMGRTRYETIRYVSYLNTGDTAATQYDKAGKTNFRGEPAMRNDHAFGAQERVPYWFGRDKIQRR